MPVATTAATPAPPMPAASRKLRRFVGLSVFIVSLLSRGLDSNQLERLRFEFNEGRADGGHVPIVIRLRRAGEGIEELRRARLDVLGEEAPLLGEGRRLAAGRSGNQHAHHLEESGEVILG